MQGINNMVLEWDKDKYKRVDGVVSVILLLSIVWLLYAWYFSVVPNSILALSIIPVGVTQLYKRKLEKLLKTYGGSQIKIDGKRLTLLKPNQGYEAKISLRKIASVKASSWLFLDKITVYLNDNKEIELINFCDQKNILCKINPVNIATTSNKP